MTGSSVYCGKPCRRGVVGGTFSLLHEGHKLLLRTATVLSCSLLVGVTSDEYVSRHKRHPVEPFDERVRAVLGFLKEVDPSVEVSIYRLDDAFGPSVEDEGADCIFVSEETFRGAFLVNLLRRIKGLEPLKVYSVEMLTVGGLRLSSSLLWSRRVNNA
ncbi:MAG: pantetheine-phosphate adenylyltransferase [Infirmifilum sp.]|uniref:pantetheine-phosphate adenylyltransferase n=1 Tax=Infirmifilum TaxID=2856573 RepID=UPI002353BED2